MKNMFLYAVNLAVIAALLCIGCDSGVNGNSEEVDMFLSMVGNRYVITLFTDDRDGKSYKRVRIGDQVWMAENLNYAAEGSKCYNNIDANCAKYGRLYNWTTAMGGKASSSANPSGVQGVCPVGWHIPSDREWSVLETAVGSRAGTKLKSTSGWNSGGNGTSAYGWSALPGGNGTSGGNFYNAGSNGLWWSATEYYANYAWSRSMYYYDEGVSRYNYDKAYLFSVRCVQD